MVAVEPVEWSGMPTPCWIWSGTLDGGGYPVLPRLVNGEQRAHRAHYKLHVGPIPPGFDVDHLCRLRACVRPDHLEAVEPTVNKQRGNGRAGVGRGEPIDFRAASLAAQRGHWAEYRALAKIDEDPLPVREKRFVLTSGFAKRWAAALRSCPDLVDETGLVDEGSAWPRTATDVLADELPRVTAERIRAGFAPVIDVQAVTGPLRAKVERVAGGEPTVAVESLEGVLHPVELASVIEEVFAEEASC
ncbi:hypothetical protein CF165_17410 [Amycolatopsis vastitatis]|uniref:HNH nuclease domain-containing protein n=2 Tax=Amycolatopsis vastitatis TaxID=1905142 RepID=A0A229T8T6_9PSEU|nr:hypothetical protein CF165_17410 [Amycolatopsis vastitatis]